MNISVQLKKNVKNNKYSLFPITHADNVLVGEPESNTILSDILKHIEINDITKESIIDTLGYTPYTPTEVDNLLSTLETNIDWKEAVDSFSIIATTYPNPEDGWTVNVKDTNYTYRYNGVEWVPISANAIPKATNSVDGLLSKEDHTKYEDANTKKHEHPNKAVLDAITAIYTSEEKTKLSGIDSGANNYTHPDTPGNKHIPAGGSSGQILRWSEDGTAMWGDENTISVEGSTHTHEPATETKNGFMSSTDKVKLNGIQDGAQVNQNSISSIIVGSATISSSRATDSLTLTGSNVTLTGDASSKSVQIGITKTNVTDALGYTPYTPTEVDNKLSTLETNIDWKEAVSTYENIATTYPNPEDGWTVNVNDTDYTYRYNGIEWVAISANAIPKATDSVDGLLSKEDHTKYEDANTKKHTHSNKTILDAITAVFTTEEKTKLSGITDNANNYTHPTESGYKHIPSGGSSGQILRWSANGTAVWGDETAGGNHKHTTLTDLTSLQFAIASNVTNSTTPIMSTIKYLSGYVGSGTALYGTALTINTALVPSDDNTFSLGISDKTWKSISVREMYSISDINFSESSNIANIKCYYDSNISKTTLKISSIIPYSSDQYFGTRYNPWDYGYFTKINLVANSSNYATIYASTYTSSGVSRPKIYVDAAICPSNTYTASVGLSDNAWNTIYTQQIYSTGGTYGFDLNGGVFVKGNLYPLSNNGYTIGNNGNLFSGIYGTNIYTKSFESTGGGIIPPITLTSNTSADYTTGGRQFIVGTQTYPFYQFYAQHSYRFSDGTWWNGISFTKSMSVPYGSSSTTASGKGLELGESGLQLRVSTSVAYFSCANGMRCNSDWYTSSDEKVKTFTDDIDIESTKLINLFDIIKLRSFKYRYRNDKTIIGVNAEELESDIRSIGMDPMKYGILHIDYNTFIPRGDDSEDDKFYFKLNSVSYEKLATISILKLQDMEKKHTARLNSIEGRLLALEQKG